MGSRARARPLPTHSGAAIDNEFVADVYARLASVYDWLFGLPLQPGRIAATRTIRPGESVLEVGVGTGITLPMYPATCRVTGIDLSQPMLERAVRRLAAQRLTNVCLLRMDAASMEFPDESFDVVYAPYLISVVPDPIKVTQEMCRVCRPNGRILLLNHFLSANKVMSWIERRVAPLAIHLGFNSALDMTRFLAESRLHPRAIARVNYPRLWSLVTCGKTTCILRDDIMDEMVIPGSVLAPFGRHDAASTRDADRLD